ncbi:hypothetical protein P170DRAFT_418031 [Aspergillus steynii IBT 23096]|uniref:Zn(2)-C6 fungal-type domain-containing protein n=1 Tax=Aspergillus steynii IBT 23096 TaxID=1392250 RepID=A0A2I2FT29_9EURO|nr:uncharacterized protein P170DRAFT_418031 [Aspergillus steynii IBT 23096]PLB43737.1 hypothetical protein P170DRAFT_418031 [Aspergillus steynii IBT 23096]
MSNDTRQASGGKGKRRLIDADEDGRPNSTAEDYASNPKRQRVSRACDSCRSKKDKCDGVQPVCSTCASLCRPCTYKANPKKRGLPTGYIRTLELLWGLVFCKIQGSEEVVRALLRAANIPSHLATMGKEAEGSDTLLSSWKNSIVLKEIEKLLVSLEQPEDEQDKGTRPGENDSPADAEGSSVDVLEWQIPEGLVIDRENSGLSPIKTPSAASAAMRTQTARMTRDSTTQTSSPGVEEIPNISLSRPLPPHLLDYRSGRESLPNPTPQLPSNAWPLLDIYFSYTQCWFPILEKHDILRTAFRHSENEAAGSGDHAALWAVLTLASIQEASISTTRQLPQPTSERPDPNLFYVTAKSFIPGENGVHEIGHAQALLILSLVKLGQQDWTAAWILVGQAVRISQCLGLDRSPGARSKHVFLGCFVLETLVATQTGQVPSLRKSDLTKVGPINEDGLEEWHPWEDQTGLRPVETSRGSFHRGPLHALSTFNRLVSLMCILNDTCCLTTTDPVPHLEASERQLQLWVSALPKSYRVVLQAERPASPHIFGLEMMYEGVVSHLSLHLALHGAGNVQTSYIKRATQSSQRLLMLLQAYMESYSLSATCPTFGMLLTSGILQSDKGQVPSTFDLEPGLKHKLHSFASHLATVWAMGRLEIDSRPTARSPSTNVPIMAASHPQGALPVIDPTTQTTSPQPPLSTTASTARRASLIDDTRVPIPGSEPFLANQWMRTPSNVEDSAALSLPTPAPSLSINRSAETSHPAPPFKDTDPHRHRASTSSSTRPTLNGTSMMSELTSPFPPAAPQYPPTYGEPNLNMGSFVDVDGYGPLRRPRIAPDLDALFDELASLDGTEKTDNLPEFMQNLGFVPDAGVPELYSYSNQVEPFLLAQNQPQMPGSETTGHLRRESQSINEVQSNPKR